jgi:type IV fimbrial biogenesis protein FimT
MLIRRSRGVSVIELMIGLLLFSVVLMLAFPNFTTMMHNMKLRGKAESILAGLHTARSEALRRNQTVEFLLTADDPDPANVGGFVANAIGPSWAVRAIDPITGPAFVEGHSGLEGSNQADPAALNVQIAASNLPAGNAIPFNGLGRVTGLGANVEIDVTNPTGGACKTTAGSEPMRCLRIVITPGGRVRMCDPSVPAVAGDTRAC